MNKQYLSLLALIALHSSIFCAGEDQPSQPALPAEAKAPLTQEQFDQVLNFLVYREARQVLDQINNNKPGSSEFAETGKNSKKFVPAEPKRSALSYKHPIDIVHTFYPQKFPITFELALHYLSNPHAFINAKKQSSNRFLFYGPPGSGKSYLAQIMHEAFKLPLIHVCCSDFMDKYYGEGEKAIREAFSVEDPYGRPVILFIDEIDGIAMKRTGEHHPGFRNIVNTLLVELQKHALNPKIFVIVATNDKDILDDAFISRFEGYTVEFKLPTKKDREKFLIQAFKDKVMPHKQELIKRIADKTDGFSLRALDGLVREADCLFFADKKPGKVFDQRYFIPFIDHIKRERAALSAKVTKFRKKTEPWLPLYSAALSTISFGMQLSPYVIGLLGIHRLISATPPQADIGGMAAS